MKLASLVIHLAPTFSFLHFYHLFLIAPSPLPYYTPIPDIVQHWLHVSLNLLNLVQHNICLKSIPPTNWSSSSCFICFMTNLEQTETWSWTSLRLFIITTWGEIPVRLGAHPLLSPLTSLYKNTFVILRIYSGMSYKIGEVLFERWIVKSLWEMNSDNK